MRRYLPLAIISALLAIAATAFNSTLLVSLLTETDSVALGFGAAIAIVLFLFSAAAFLIAAVLALIGLILVKKSGGGGMVTVYAVELTASILFPILSYVILFLLV